MDESNSSIFIILFSSFLIIYRFINNLLKAGYFGLGQISLLALAEKAKENKSSLVFFLEDPNRLNLSTQVFDKLSLILLILPLLIVFPNPGPFGYLVFLVFLLSCDILLPTIAAFFFAEPLVTRLFPIMRPPFLMLYPITYLTMTLMEKNKNTASDDEEEDPEDIRAFLRAGTEEGIIEEKEQPLLHNIITFNDTVVREVMTPRTDMVCIDLAIPIEEILETFKTTKFSRIPIFRTNIDHIEGVLRFKDVIVLPETTKFIEDCITETIFVPEQKLISDLLAEMLKRRLQMAIVIDEYGGTAGLITLEDLIEEIVGEIHDEHETPDADHIIDLKDGSFMVDGKVLLDDFCEMFAIETEDEGVDTIGGFIFYKEGHIPKEGSICDVGGLKVEISKADGRRIYKLKVFTDSLAE